MLRRPRRRNTQKYFSTRIRRGLPETAPCRRDARARGEDSPKENYAGLGEELDADYPKSRAPGTVVSHPMCSVIARLSVRVSSPSADHWNALLVWGDLWVNAVIRTRAVQEINNEQSQLFRSLRRPSATRKFHRVDYEARYVVRQKPSPWLDNDISVVT